ncbi:hypothetical protein XELAEV_18047072mg, partial [Xenopus laevis]
MVRVLRLGEIVVREGPISSYQTTTGSAGGLGNVVELFTEGSGSSGFNAYLGAFFGAFRVGELVSQSKGTPGGLRHEDVELREDQILLWLCWSKIDRMGKGSVIVLLALGGGLLCHRISLQHFLDVRPRVGGPLLVSWVNPFWNCFRKGEATEASRLRLCEQIVKRIG